MNDAAPLAGVERFAKLCALIDNGSSTRADVLAAVGLDEAGWQALRADWLPRLAADDAGELAQHFGRAYARARQHPGYFALPEPERMADEDTEVDAPVSGPDTDPMQGTHADASPLAGPALPFQVPALLPLRASVPPPAPSEPAALRVPVDPAEATLEIPYAPLPAAAALPFSAPAPPNAPGGGPRLQRFDTQTGLPRETPVWVAESMPSR